jgi:hypothetical protein
MASALTALEPAPGPVAMAKAIFKRFSSAARRSRSGTTKSLEHCVGIVGMRARGVANSLTV